MKPSTRRVVGLVSAWLPVIIFVAVVSAQQPAAPAAPAGQKTAQEIAFERFQRAERVMNLSCSVSGCHTIRPIQTAAKDEAGWTQTIAMMVEKGAKITPEDTDVLKDYLVRYHGPLPEGDGRAVLLNICTMCHDLKRIRFGRRSPDEKKKR